MKIIVDTREQTPWTFPPWIETERGTLNFGDYALQGDSTFAIERKSADDFAGTVSSGWERFQREFARMDKAGCIAKVVVVEAPFDTFCFTETDGHYHAPKHNHYRLTPAFIRKRIAELLFMGVTVIFAGNADLATGIAMSIFAERERHLGVEHDGNS